MRTYLITIITTLLLVMNIQGQNYQENIPESYGFKVALGETVPDFTLELVDGTKTTMQALRGKIVMLQFTASWCPVCREEMPHIEKNIWLKHKVNPAFALYGIDLEEKPEEVTKFQKDIKTTYPIALDQEGSIFYSFVHQNAGVTRNVIIDKAGKIVFMTRLFNQDEFDHMCEVIDELLK